MVDGRAPDDAETLQASDRNSTKDGNCQKEGESPPLRSAKTRSVIHLDGALFRYARYDACSGCVTIPDRTSADFADMARHRRRGPPQAPSA
eukprot:859865-Pyramimonas_sp.AAC.1